MSKKASEVCKYCHTPIVKRGTAMFQRNTCVKCRLANASNKARIPRMQRKVEMAAKWKEFVAKHNILWYRFKSHKWGGRGSAGAILNMSDFGGPKGPVHVGFWRRRVGAWVTVTLAGNELAFESRCFATWRPDRRYNTLREWQKPGWTQEKCECGACAATKALISLSCDSSQGPASLPEMAISGKTSALTFNC